MNMMKTKSAGGIVIRGDLVLVVNQNNTSWSLPKGHIERGETDIQTAKREIYEESGIRELKLIKKLDTYQRHKIGKSGREDKSEFKTITMFLFKTEQKILKPVDLQNPQAVWVRKDMVANLLTHPKDKEFYLKAIKNINL